MSHLKTYILEYGAIIISCTLWIVILHFRIPTPIHILGLFALNTLVLTFLHIMLQQHRLKNKNLTDINQ